MCFLASKYDDILAISKQLTTNSCHTMLLPFNKAIHYNNRDSLVRNLFGSLQRVGYWQINVDAFLEFKASMHRGVGTCLRVGGQESKWKEQRIFDKILAKGLGQLPNRPLPAQLQPLK